MGTRRFTGMALAAALAVGGLLAGATGAAAGEVTTGRIGGATRYETAVLVAQERFVADGALAGRTLYVASGETFADALPGGVLAANDNSVLLLVKKDSIPAVVGAEIRRLDPADVVIFGGPAAVSDAVRLALLDDFGLPSTRLAGADRYETAAVISRDGNWDFVDAVGVETALWVHIASGEDFPDALAGGPYAAYYGDGPILLARAGSLPAVTAAEVARINGNTASGFGSWIQGVAVFGGPGALAAGVVGAVEEIWNQPAGTVAARGDWLYGENRFGTSAEIARYEDAVFGRAFSGKTIYLASGADYPDALVATPLAASGGPRSVLNAPVLLVSVDSIDPAVCAVLGDVATPDARIVALGGTAAISDAVLARAAACVSQP